MAQDARDPLVAGREAGRDGGWVSGPGDDNSPPITIEQVRVAPASVAASLPRAHRPRLRVTLAAGARVSRMRDGIRGDQGRVGCIHDDHHDARRGEWKRRSRGWCT